MIPKKWQEKKLKDVLSTLKDGTHFSPKSTSGTYKYITSKNIRFGKMDLSNISYISEDEHNQIFSSSPVYKGDVLLTKDGANTGNVALNILDEPFSLLSSVAILRGKHQVLLNEYLLQTLLSPIGQNRIKNEMAGQAITRLTLIKIGQLIFLIPPLSEQKAIANILQAWDSTIEKTEALIVAKEKQLEGLQVNIFEMPRNEECLLFSDIFTESRIIDFKNNPSKRLTVHLHLKGVSIRELRGTEAEDATQFFVRRAGQFIYGKQNIFRGALGFIPPEFDGYCSSQDLPAFDVSNKVDRDWLYWYMSRSNFYKKLEHLASGSGSKRFHPKELFKMKIKIPQATEQQRIANILNTAKQEINLLKQQADLYRTQKRGLMQKLLTGEWRVKV